MNFKKVLFLMGFSIIFTPHASAQNNQFEQVLSHFAVKYTNYCGHEEGSPKLSYSKGNWNNYKDCLTDGRIHLVYANTKEGKHGNYPIERNNPESTVEFTDKDKSILLNAIYEGAQIYVGETNHKVFCVESSIHPTNNEAVCSTTDRIYANWPIDSNLIDTGDGRKRFPAPGADAEYNRYLSNGHREHHHIHLDETRDTKIADNTDAYYRSKIISQQGVRWYIRY